MSRTTFQLRPSAGTWSVYLVRLNGREIPVANQQAVYGPETAARAQVICDSLNRGLLTRVTAAAQVAAYGKDAAEVTAYGKKR